MSKFLSSIVILGIAMAWVPTAWCQQDEEDLGAVVEAQIEALEAARADGPAPAVIAELTALYQKIDDKKIRKQIANEVASGMGSRNADVRLEAAGALGELGEDGAKELRSSLRKAKKDQDLRIKIVQAMGKNADVSLIGELTKLLNDKDFSIIATAAESLGGYEGTKLGYRVKIVGEMLKVYTSAENSARDPKNSTAVRKNNIIKAPMNAALYKLTGQGLDSADAYWKWYGDAKKNPRVWPKEKDESDS